MAALTIMKKRHFLIFDRWCKERPAPRSPYEEETGKLESGYCVGDSKQHTNHHSLMEIYFV